MTVAAPVISERERQSGGCCTPLVEPDLTVEEALRLAVVAKALADPTRLRIVDALRKASPEAVCQCELLPLFQMSQPALAKHLRVLVAAGIVRSERRGLWAFYYADLDALGDLRRWLS
jgi:ArsR family transcriptional regulator, arsenate/arsenite/antimonite-responsive transcriptional repressor